jgi:hypothetical protein
MPHTSLGADFKVLRLVSGGDLLGLFADTFGVRRIALVADEDIYEGNASKLRDLDVRRRHGKMRNDKRSRAKKK